MIPGQVCGETTVTPETSSSTTPQPLISSPEPTLSNGGTSRPRPIPTTTAPLRWQVFLEVDSACHNIQATGDPSELCLGSRQRCQVRKINKALISANVDGSGSPTGAVHPTVLMGPDGHNYTTGQQRIVHFRVGMSMTWIPHPSDRSSRCCFAITSLDPNATDTWDNVGKVATGGGDGAGSGGLSTGWIVFIGVMTVSIISGAVVLYRRYGRPDVVYRFDNPTLMRGFTREDEGDGYGEVEEDVVYSAAGEHDVRRRGSGARPWSGRAPHTPSSLRSTESRL